MDEKRSPIDFVRRIVLNVARRLPSHIDRDDLIGEGLLHLVEAEQRFDPSKRVPFDGFVTSRIRGAVLDWCRRNDSLSRRDRKRAIEGGERFADRVVFNDGLVKHAIDQLDKSVAESSQRNQEEESRLERLTQALDTLTQTDYEIIVRRFYNDEPVFDIAQSLGVSDSRVSQRTFLALRQLRRAMGDERPMLADQSRRFTTNRGRK